MIDQARIHVLNDRPVRGGSFVLYWMQASQRTRFNHALEEAIMRANALDLPIIVCFGLMDDYPEANARHYAFMLDGLGDVQQALARRRIRFVVRRGLPPDVALHYGARAALIVCDRGYLRHQRQWRDHVADRAKCCVVEVESDVVVPVEVVSDKHEFAARTIRPKIHKHWVKYLKPLAMTRARRSSLRMKIAGNLDVSDSRRMLSKLKLDRSVKPVDRTGGETTARHLLRAFIRGRLKGYASGRNEPSVQHTSLLSAALHFGRISPIEMALAAKQSRAPKADRDAFLEELIVRRELSMNFCWFNPKYDSYAALPAWAKKTLADHRRDKRPHIYTLRELESAKTHDPYWNSAQMEMVKTGYMHNYMRMYWGKKIIEWTQSPERAFQRALYLNNRYLLDGRDANSFANVAWLFGLHDRPWGPARKIFGTVRYMNDAGLERKFDMEAYVAWVDRPQGRNAGRFK